MNPFNPSFGRVPPIFLDREKMLGEIRKGLDNINSAYQTCLICGQRGTGKTAFLTDISSSVQKDSSWIVADLPATGELLQILIQSIYRQTTDDVQKAPGAIHGVKISVLGEQAEYQRNENLQLNYQTLLEAVLERLKEKHIKLLITIDEVSATKEIREFASVYQIMIRKGYHVTLLMTGLPRNISELQNDNILTFLLRSARIELGTLDLISVKESYRETFNNNGWNAEDKVLTMMAARTAGYAYAFQLLGYLIWDTEEYTVTEATLEKVYGEYRRQLYRNVYTKIYDDLSNTDREFVKAVAEDENTEVARKDIEARMHKSTAYVSNYRKRLIDSQIIMVSTWGYVKFTLPYFKEYVNDRIAFESV